MTTGNIVRISNAYFKNDNGLYFVEHSPKDPGWCGQDYCLKKIKRNGELSTAKHNIAFWPLSSYCSDRQKNYDAMRWNRVNAKIEIVNGIQTGNVAEYFQGRADGLSKDLKWMEYNWGADHPETERIRDTRSFYEDLAQRLKIS